MRAVGLGMAAGLLGWAMPAAAQNSAPNPAPQPQMMFIYSGKCSAESHRAGKRFACDSVVSVEGKPGSLMLIFLRGNGPDDAVLGVKGSLAGDGSLIVEQVEVSPGERRDFDGSCAMEHSGPHITAVRCTAIERGGKRRIEIEVPKLVLVRP